MSLYSNNTVKQLSDLLKQRNLSAVGNKNELIQRLLADDNAVINDDNGENEDEVVSVDANAAVALSDEGPQVAADNDSGESEAVRVLKLQIELAKLNLEQAKISQSAKASSSTSAAGQFDCAGVMKVKLPVMTENSDMLIFLSSFERCLTLNGVSRDQYFKYLPGVLNEKANSVLASLSISDCCDYDVCRQVLLNEFRSTPEVYRRKLLSLRRSGNENYRAFLRRLEELHSHYLTSKDICDFDSLRRDVILNLFIDALPSNVKEFVLQRQPKDGNEAASLSDLFFSVRNVSNDGRQNQKSQLRPFQKPKTELEKTSDRQEIGNSADIKADANERAPKNVAKPPAKKGKTPGACWGCGSLSHQQKDCMVAKSNQGKNPVCAASDTQMDDVGSKFVVPIFVANDSTEFKGMRDSAARTRPTEVKLEGIQLQ